MHTIEPAHSVIPSQADLISAQLAETGMSVSEFSRRLGVAPSYIFGTLRGAKRLTNDDTIQRAAKVLGISIDPLYLAIDRTPPDVLAMMQQHPILLDAVRKLNAKFATQEVHHATR